MRAGTLEPFLGCKSLRQLLGLAGLWRDVFIFQNVSVRIQILPIPSPRGKDFSLSNPERREMAALPLYTDRGNLFFIAILCVWNEICQS